MGTPFVIHGHPLRAIRVEDPPMTRFRSSQEPPFGARGAAAERIGGTPFTTRKVDGLTYERRLARKMDS
ncbi:hypothetical protein GCM10010234_16480 [Streptomyces hawaiiensis]